MIFTESQPKYSVLDLGFTKLLVKVSVDGALELSTPELANVFTSGVAPKSLLAGELLEFVDTGQAGVSGLGDLGTDIRFWAGDTFENRASAPFRVDQNGEVIASDLTITGGSVPTSLLTGIVDQGNLDVANAGWSQTCAFSVTDLDTVAWGAGSFITASGTTYSINASNTDTRLTAAGLTSPMNARIYIYLNTASSTTEYQCTYTAATAVGAGKVLLATAINGAVEAVFEVFGGVGGLNINASSIVSLSITANEIAASTITSGKLSVSQLSAIAADMGSLTAGTITGALIRTAASGARVEVSGAANRVNVYNAAGTNYAYFGGAGADGTLFNGTIPSGSAYSPFYMTSAGDGNIIQIVNTNASNSVPALAINTNGNVSHIALQAINTGTGTCIRAEATSNAAENTTGAALLVIQNGTTSMIATGVAGCYLSKAGTWTDASSKTLKENFEEVSVLDKLKTLDILQYNYKVDSPRTEQEFREYLILTKKREKFSQTEIGSRGIKDDAASLQMKLNIDEMDEIEQKFQEEMPKEQARIAKKHFTPMAEDFNRIFQLGDDKGMSPNDVAGVALQAIKELLTKVESLEAKINAIV